jgi:hypothetical protein
MTDLLVTRRDRLEARIGNALEGFFVVTAEGTRLSWRGPDTGPHADNDEICLKEDDWCVFWTSLGQLAVWAWDGQTYETSGVLDGTHWRVEAEHMGRSVRASGNNGYPGDAGPVPSGSFVRFCGAVTKLAGGRRFE